MSTIEDFKSAPVGTTATHDKGTRAMKVNDGDQYWITSWGSCLSDEQMGLCGYTFDSFESRPASTREAVELAWDLAHKVKEGQVIPVGAWLVDRRDSKIIVEKNTFFNIAVDEWGAENIRTLEPLHEQEPDWLDAPAILASHPLCADTERIGIWLPSLYKDDMWELPAQQGELRVHWSELESVTPLHPKEDA